MKQDGDVLHLNGRGLREPWYFRRSYKHNCRQKSWSAVLKLSLQIRIGAETIADDVTRYGLDSVDWNFNETVNYFRPIKRLLVGVCCLEEYSLVQKRLPKVPYSRLGMQIHHATSALVLGQPEMNICLRNVNIHQPPFYVTLFVITSHLPNIVAIYPESLWYFVYFPHRIMCRSFRKWLTSW